MLTFDAEKHEYRFNGKPVINVTRLLAPLTSYEHIPPAVLETARQRGVAVHKLVELDCHGDLDEDGLPEWMQPVLFQWRKFAADTGFRMLASEYRVYHPTYQYAGTLDLFGHVFDAVAFVDVKRSFAAGGAIGLQLAGYQEAYCAQEKVGKRSKRYALKLSEVGPYRLEEFSDKSDWTTFLALLTLHRWREANQRSTT